MVQSDGCEVMTSHDAVDCCGLPCALTCMGSATAGYRCL
jgi:hypothetical protein